MSLSSKPYQMSFPCSQRHSSITPNGPSTRKRSQSAQRPWSRMSATSTSKPRYQAPTAISKSNRFLTAFSSGPTAQVASQEGAFLARLFNQMAKTEQLDQELKELSEAQDKAPNQQERDRVFERYKELQKRLRRVKQMGPFEYSHQGSLAYIGSEKAVADISWLTGN